MLEIPCLENMTEFAFLYIIKQAQNETRPDVQKISVFYLTTCHIQVQMFCGNKVMS